MYCPYRTVVEQVTVTKSGENEASVTTLHERVEFLPCYEDDCAMWQDGQCWKRG